ncbi:JAB domain-containing protein [Caminibacter mediatlanticus TB-2]|uniref:JAB domain-containing protein n=1 Tax=Caminibacter mediatlanticus TB-2 TaxID=391592 RepID=A0ABX5V8S0_9BACT|nr:DNA repair protein RadC [Caminibacter mediatlanticus]QCT94628.1 JAB domain-containing protein [Caminibacter mediatlanticus TB-2]
MKKLKELENLDKPREKLIKKGLKALKDYELMAILLGSGVKNKDVLKLSKEIINLFQKDFNLLNLEKLLSIHGLGIAKASQILSAIELSKRYLIKQNKKITSPKDIYYELKEYQNKKQEYFIALYLDGANYLCFKEVITIGILNQSLVHPREVFAPAIENRCASIIIAHNHPSGELIPSEADIKVTKRLKESGKILGIELLDHIIISKDGFYSFSENMLI